MKKFNNRRGEGYVGSGIKILIAVVLGALLLGGLYTLTKDVVMQNASDRVEEMFHIGQDHFDLSAGIEAYETRSKSGSRVYDGEEFFVISEILLSEYKLTTLDGVPLNGADGEVYTSESEPGWLMVEIPSDYIRTVPAGVHTVRVYNQNGNYSAATFEKR